VISVLNLKLEAFSLSLELHEVFVKLTGAHALSFPTRYPLLRLDRLYVRALKPTSASVLHQSPWSFLSDHAPILAELDAD
jgi:endonuclease/exonuclease/phosphatase family metal-dependent hydrolase